MAMFQKLKQLMKLPKRQSTESVAPTSNENLSEGSFSPEQIQALMADFHQDPQTQAAFQAAQGQGNRSE